MSQSQSRLLSKLGETTKVWTVLTHLHCSAGSRVPFPHAEHEAIIRALAFDRLGKFMLTAGDDKSVRVWDCQTWSLVLTA